MMFNILIHVNNIKHIDDYRKAGISAFLFALEDYCVGYNTYSLQEIKNTNVSNKYILLNRLLDCKDIDKLKIILKDLKDIKGIVFEDIAVYQLVKKLDIKIETILFQNHFTTNSLSINFWLNRVNSVLIGNEITQKEIEYIVNNSIKPICLHVYGHNQIMYSRRTLLTNWSKEFAIPYKEKNTIQDKATKIKFRVFENKYGTVMYSNTIYNGKKLFQLNQAKIKYFYVNPTLVDNKQVIEFLHSKESALKSNEDNGFLEKETIYKLKERKK